MKNVSLFECSKQPVDVNNGVVYNDFDTDTQQLLQLTHQQNISFSHETEEPLACRDIVPEKAVAYAVLAADDTEAILYPHLCFERELQDCISSPRNKDYMEKVYKLQVLFLHEKINRKIYRFMIYIYISFLQLRLWCEIPLEIVKMQIVNVQDCLKYLLLLISWRKLLAN